MKKNTTIGTMLILSAAFLTSTGAYAQTTPSNDTTHRLMKTQNEQGKRVFVIQKYSGKMLYVYPEENNSTGQVKTSENIKKTSESLILYPNPTPGTCNILYNVEKTGTVLLELVNMEGKTVSTLLNKQKENGSYTLTIDLSGYNNGTYFIRYSTNSELSVKKILKIEQ